MQIFTGQIPFSQKRNDSSVIFSVLGGGRPELPAFLKEKESLAQLVQECWDQEPGRRPTSRAVTEKLLTEVLVNLLTLMLHCLQIYLTTEQCNFGCWKSIQRMVWHNVRLIVLYR
jgi:hypothetical protein